MRKNRMIFPILSTTIVSVPLLATLSCGNSVKEALWKPGATSTQVWGVACTGTEDATQTTQAREVLSQFANSEHYIETSPDMSDELVASTYINAINRGAKVIVSASGSHRNVIEKVLASHKEVSLFRSARFITIDEQIDSPQVFNLRFNLGEGAFLAGVLAANYALSVDSKTPELVAVSAPDTDQVGMAVQFEQGAKFYNQNFKTNVTVKQISEAQSNASAALSSVQNGAEVVFAPNKAMAFELNRNLTSYENLSNRRIVATIPALSSSPRVLAVLNRNIATALTATLNEVYNSFVETPQTYGEPNLALKLRLSSLTASNADVSNSLWGQTLFGGLENGLVGLMNETALFSSPTLATIYDTARKAAR